MQTTCPALWAQQGGAQGSYCCTAAQVVNIGLSTQKVIPFVVGCPACLHNFVHLWCALTCSPDQSSWAEVVAVQQAADTNVTVVSE
ncbi:oxygen-evolving enhancer protein 2, chloroplastic, partial [Haematococcus lacustris]